MLRRLTPVAGFALALVLCLSVRGQDSPSLGDIARQAQKDKANRPAANSKVITNDDMPSNSSGGPAALGAGLGQIAQPSASSKTAASLSPADKLAMMETLLDKLETVDRAALVRNVLNGNDVDFPGRAKWEDRLLSAKVTYVAQGRDLMQKVREIIASADSLKGQQDPNDPRVKEMSARLQSLIRDAVKMDSTFQAVMMEGRDLAAQASSH